MGLETTLINMVGRDGFVDVSIGSPIRKGYSSILFDRMLRHLSASGYPLFVIKIGGHDRFKFLAKPGTTIKDIIVECLNRSEDKGGNN